MALPESTRVKSILLAQLMGWQFAYAAEGVCMVMQGADFVGTSTAFWFTEAEPHVDFYDAENMALAWKIMALTIKRDPKLMADFKNWWQNQNLYQLTSPKTAQGLWLDKILELAIAAQMVSC